MTMEWRDITGNGIEVGDFVVYAALWDRSATLKYGRVTKLKKRDEYYRKDIPTIAVVSVDRDFNNVWNLQNNGRDVTLSFLDRLLRVEPDQVPHEAWELIHDKSYDIPFG